MKSILRHLILNLHYYTLLSSHMTMMVEVEPPFECFMQYLHAALLFRGHSNIFLLIQRKLPSLGYLLLFALDKA